MPSLPSLDLTRLCVYHPRARRSHGGVVWPGSILWHSLRIRVIKRKHVCVSALNQVHPLSLLIEYVELPVKPVKNYLHS